MPVGPFPTIDACLLDAGLAKAYPDEATRRKVCARLESTADAAAAPIAAHDDATHMGATIIEGDSYWLVRGNTAAREGVNGRGEYKPWADLHDERAVASLDGAPFVWGHPERTPGNPNGFVQNRAEAAGVVLHVSGRPDHTLAYDLILWKPGAQGGMSALDAQRNQLAVRALRAGVAIHNSGGYVFMPVRAGGIFTAHDGSRRAYSLEQRFIRFDHVAGLAPITPGPGACPLSDGCGIGVASDEVATCSCPVGGVSACCLLHGGDAARRAKRAVDALRESSGASEIVALQAIISASKRT